MLLHDDVVRRYALYTQNKRGHNPEDHILVPFPVFNTSLLYIFSQSSGDSDLIGIEDNPEFSPYARSGIQNGGFTPEMGSGIQASVNVKVATGFERRASINPLSAGALQDAIAGNTTRSQSVNPMAGTFNGDESDYENDSTKSGDNSMQQNNNFTFFQRSDSAQTTEL
jgi:hypothetical protein